MNLPLCLCSQPTDSEDDEDDEEGRGFTHHSLQLLSPSSSSPLSFLSLSGHCCHGKLTELQFGCYWCDEWGGSVTCGCGNYLYCRHCIAGAMFHIGQDVSDTSWFISSDKQFYIQDDQFSQMSLLGSPLDTVQYIWRTVAHRGRSSGKPKVTVQRRSACQWGYVKFGNRSKKSLNCNLWFIWKVDSCLFTIWSHQVVHRWVLTWEPVLCSASLQPNVCFLEITVLLYERSVVSPCNCDS